LRVEHSNFVKINLKQFCSTGEITQKVIPSGNQITSQTFFYGSHFKTFSPIRPDLASISNGIGALADKDGALGSL